jgi:predicted P-loop ATPase
MTSELVNSGKKNPCPVCNRTKDNDCGWKPDLSLVLCHTYLENTLNEVNGFYWTGKYSSSKHGPESLAIYSNSPPKTKNNHRPNTSRRKAEKSSAQKDRAAQLRAAEIEAHVDHLAMMVREGSETPDQATVALAAWCGEHGHDNFSSQKMLRGKLESINNPDTIDMCGLAKRYRKVEARVGDRMRFNEMRSAVEIDGKAIDVDDLRIELALRYNLDLPAKDCDRVCIHVAKKQSYHPIREYLDDCRSRFGPNDELLSGVAKEYLGCESDLHSAYIRKTLISAVARAKRPGCKVDQVCILTGPQGFGKSAFWSILAGEYFDDSVGNSSDKDERLKLHQSWFIEWAELETMFNRKDVSSVKAFLTTRVDKVRPPYGRGIIEMSRPSIIVGTTNHDEFLADATGSRRFWVCPINLPKLDFKKLKAQRDQIWASAVWAYEGGEPWILPNDLKALAAEENEKYSLTDPWEDAIDIYTDNRDEVTAEEILRNVLNIDLGIQTRAQEMRVTDILKKKKFIRSRRLINGIHRRFWKKTEST